MLCWPANLSVREPFAKELNRQSKYFVVHCKE